MFTNKDIIFFKKAKSAANLSDYNKEHIGCIAVYRGKVIGVGYNTNKTNTTQYYYDRFRKIKSDKNYSAKLHAEISCINSIKNMDIKFNKVKLYIYRLKRDGTCGISKPCKACINAIKDLGIKHIYYTLDDGYVYERYN